MYLSFVAFFPTVVRNCSELDLRFRRVYRIKMAASWRTLQAYRTIGCEFRGRFIALKCFLCVLIAHLTGPWRAVESLCLQRSRCSAKEKFGRIFGTVYSQSLYGGVFCTFAGVYIRVWLCDFSKQYWSLELEENWSTFLSRIQRSSAVFVCFLWPNRVSSGFTVRFP